MTLIGPTAGVVNDRLRRKQVMIASDLGRMLIVLCMLLIRSKEKVWMVYPLLMAETLLVAFFEPARNAVIPNIVEREDVVVANTLSSTTWSVNLMVGATLGGVVAALLGRDAVFLLNALSFVASAALIWRMRFAEPHAEGTHHFELRELVDFSPILAGIRYVRAHARLRATVLVKFGNLIIGPGWVLFTVMGQNEFAVRWRGMAPERGAFLGMSLLLGARGLGALLGPLLAASWAGHWQRRLEVAIFWGYMGRVRRLHFAGRVRASVAGVFVRDAGAFWKFHRMGVLDDAVADAKRRPVSRSRLRRGSWALHVYDCRGRLSCRTLRRLGLRRAERRQRRGHVDADSGGTVEFGDQESGHRVIPKLWVSKGPMTRWSDAPIQRSWSIFAARMKSDSVSPSTACVQVVISTLPHPSKISG